MYEQLRNEGLMVIAVALDTGGADAVRDRVLATGQEDARCRANTLSPVLPGSVVSGGESAMPD